MADRSARARPLPDQAARDRIEQTLDRNLFVEAGAGSGKTESLARRMAAGIAAGVYDVDGMAAVTFTRKAAAELRGRFRLELERRLGDSRDAGERRRLDGALDGIERLTVGTIHAFCARLIRERPVEAGVPPGFTELDDIEGVATRQRSWRDFLDRERARGSARLAALEEAGVRPAVLDGAFGTVCMFSDAVFPAADVPRPDHRPAWAALRAFWSSLEPLVPATIPPDARCGVLDRARRLRARLRVLGDDPRGVEVAELLKPWTSGTFVQKWWADTTAGRRAAAAAVTPLVGRFRADTVEPFVRAWRHHCYGVAMPLLVEARAFAAEARRRAVTLDYGDLLEVAAQLLRTNPDVRAVLQAKYRWLFVDEFQDTNPLQAEVLMLLAAGAGEPPEWRRARPRSGALFVVGDPKQSIFRFTGADIDTYGAVRDVITRAAGEVVPLTASFRAVPALCDWANRVFADPGFFPAAPRREQPTFQRLEAVRPAGVRATTGLRTLVIPEQRGGAAAVAATDAGAIARWIRAEVEAGRRGWGDFIILTRRKAHLAIYAAALDALQVPAAVSGSVAFSASADVAALAMLLGVLADPDDAVSLVGVLRGPLFGISDAELYEHRRAGHPFLLTLPLPDDAVGPVADAMRRLSEMFRWARTLAAGAAVGRIVETTGLIARAVAATSGGGDAGTLLHALDRVRQVNEQGGTLADAAAALAHDLDGTEVESVPLEPGRQDVVRVMNLHKAKGLEAPVVILADPCTGVAPRASVRIVRDADGARGYLRIATGAYGGDVVAEPEGWETHEADELVYVEAEETRLLYVAGTRAKDLLVVSCYEKAGGVRPWERFARWLLDAPRLDVPAAMVAPGRPVPEVNAVARAAADAERTGRALHARIPGWRVDSVTATAHRAAPYGRPVPPGSTREPDTGLAWGRLIHGLLEWAMRGPQRSRADLERLATWLAWGQPELQRVLRDAVDTVDRVMAATVWQHAMAAEERHVEVPLAICLDGAPPSILHGVIDLAYRNAEGWHLIDWKTDQASIDVMTLRYRDQLRAYATGWSSAAAGVVVTARLYGVRDGVLSANLLA